MPILKTIALLALASQLVSCAHRNPYFDASKAHRRENGFQNNYIEFEPKGIAALLRWRYEAWRNDLPRPPEQAPPVVTPDVAAIAANATAGDAMTPAVTFIGHASVLAQLGGLNVLLDPVLSERASPLTFIGPKRFQPPGLTAAQLPHIDVVLVSHNHYDHLDAATIDALETQPGGAPLFIVPLGIKPWLEARGIARAVELDWWETHRVEGPKGMTDIMLTPAQHWSGRGLADRLATLWGGFAVLAPDFHLLYTGDTAYSADFVDIRKRLAPRQTPELGGGFDLALIPIGAYEPRWFMQSQHVNPKESVQIHADVGAKRSMGVHWGTFALTDEPLDEPPKALARERLARSLANDAFFTLAIGQTMKLPPRR